MQRVMAGLEQKEKEKLELYAVRDAEAKERLRLLGEEQVREEEKKKLEHDAKAREQVCCSEVQ